VKSDNYDVLTIEKGKIEVHLRVRVGLSYLEMPD